MRPEIAHALSKEVIDSLADRELPPMESEMKLFGPENLIRDTPDAWMTSEYMEGALFRPTPVSKLSGGRVEVHCVKMMENRTWDGFPLHYHEVDIQLICITKGWMRFFFEGAGELLLKAGDIVYQPAMNRHREIAASPDLELIEIILPDAVTTTLISPNDQTGGWDTIPMHRQDFEDSGRPSDQ